MINITAETDQNDFSNVELRLIKPINKDTVHKICSGQVVLSLAVAVKELVENALDAGATNIEVRFKNYGIDLIEVIDNGSGVADNNFAALALKYHTSKLNEYSDLLGVTSFGFRGEALSSLCALSNLTVTTKHKTSEYATRIEYDHEGNITKKTPCSRQVGTTVSLSNLFHSLPVRQKEFHKNVKREFNKMTQLLYAYCLISLGVKITSNNVTNSNSKSIVVSTQGSLSYKDNIASVFGVKQLNTLLKIKPEYEPCIRDNILKGLSGEIKEIDDTIDIKDVEINLSEESNDAENSETSASQNSFSQKSQGHFNYSCPVEFTGYISSCAHGSGRSSTDRQFYYVNSRPCEPTKVIKLVNEIYRQYNPHQYPFVFLNLNLERTCVDVNVTPDKRQIFLTKEKIILDVLKSSLLKLFECIPRTLKVESTSNSKNSNVRDNQASMLTSFLQKFGNASKLNNSNNDSSQNITKGDLKRKTTTLLDFVSTKQKKICNNNNDTKETSIEIKLEDNKVNETADDCSFIDLDNENIEVQNKHYLYLEGADNIPETQIRNVEDIVVEKSHTIYCKPKKKNKCINEERPEKKPRIITDKEDLGKHDRKFIVMKTSVEHVTSLCNLYNTQKDKTAPNKIKFKSEINPVYNKKCEDELSREISSDSFKRMTIIGQFNLGFIITQLEDDLFIIDQHASDEIYNFETLQKTTELTSQKLVIPQQLDLTGVNEQVLMDHLDIFRKNGFTFTINEQAMPTKRVKLLTIPMSRNWIFGKEDIEELLFMLRESPSEYCRPSRVRAMFASRACRKSVMIGTALSKTDMRTLVNHMADIDKPWNCPHGRPTIRHLVNLAMVQTQNSTAL